VLKKLTLLNVEYLLSPKHNIGSLIGMEAKPDSFLEIQYNTETQKPKTIFWSSVVAGSIEPDICFVPQW